MDHNPLYSDETNVERIYQEGNTEVQFDCDINISSEIVFFLFNFFFGKLSGARAKY